MEEQEDPFANLLSFEAGLRMTDGMGIGAEAGMGTRAARPLSPGAVLFAFPTLSPDPLGHLLSALMGGEDAADLCHPICADSCGALGLGFRV